MLCVMVNIIMFSYLSCKGDSERICLVDTTEFFYSDVLPELKSTDGNSIMTQWIVIA